MIKLKNNPFTATCFKGAKSFHQCKEYLLKAANCYNSNKSSYHAAKHLEQAIMMCKELNDLTDVENLAMQAGTLFLEQGKIDVEYNINK